MGLQDYAFETSLDVLFPVEDNDDHGNKRFAGGACSDDSFESGASFGGKDGFWRVHYPIAFL
jgi:hypothetical protein